MVKQAESAQKKQQQKQQTITKAISRPTQAQNTGAGAKALTSKERRGERFRQRNIPIDQVPLQKKEVITEDLGGGNMNQDSTRRKQVKFNIAGQNEAVVVDL